MYFISFTYTCDDGYLPQYTNTPPGDSTSRAIMITWSPFDDGSASHGPAKYDNILNGSYDSYINACAAALAARPTQKFLIRFMHEMNLKSSPSEWPWNAGQPWNAKPDGSGDTDKFKQVWRYVHDKFVAAGATNVQWVWSPNWSSNPDPSTPGYAWNDIHNYYPGDAYVDWIGLSGYNWYPFLGYTSPSTYSAIYNAVLTDLQCSYAKPIVHAEIGSTDSLQQSKASWIADAYMQMTHYPLLRSVVWFNDFSFHATDQADFRVVFGTGNNYGPLPLHPAPPINSSWTTAYNSAVSPATFTPTYDSSKLLNPPMTRCASDSVSNNGVLGVRPATNLVGKTGTTTTNFSVGALGLSSDTNFTVSGCPADVTCTFASSGTGTSATRTAPWSGDTLNISVSGGATVGPYTLTISGGGTSTTVQLTIAQSISSAYLPLVIK
jgi:beta-mannanase